LEEGKTKMPEKSFSPAQIIDAHVHIMTPRRIRGGIRWIRKAISEYYNLPLEVTAEELVRHMQEAGVKAFFNYFYPLQPGESQEINRWQKEMALCCPGFVPFASLHPGDSAKEEIVREALSDPVFAGFKFHPYIQQFDPLDDRMTKVYSLLEKAGCLTTLHTGFSVFYQLPSQAGSILEFLRRYPGLKVIAAHMLSPDLPLEEIGEIALAYPNLYLDATNILWWYQKYAPYRTETLKQFIQQFSSRMVFGTDYPMGMTYPVRDLYVHAFSLCPTQEAAEDLFWRTAYRLLPPWHQERLEKLIKAVPKAEKHGEAKP